MYSLIILLLCAILCVCSNTDQVKLSTVNVMPESINHFWKNTGLCPPAPRNESDLFFSSEDFKINTLLIGRLPNKAIKYIRIHWLLDLVSISSNVRGNVSYNMSRLESTLSWLHEINLYPIFELMGNPGSYFTDFEQPDQYGQWRKLVRDLVKRCVDWFGIDYVSEWKFESWNEPDLKVYNVLNFTLPGYLAYLDASRKGLTDVSGHLNGAQFVFGGPAGVFKDPRKHRLCWGALKYCDRTKKCPFDYLSFHKKGNESADAVLVGGFNFFNSIKSKYPNLRKMRIANTEADILTGWSKSREWRADVRYAAMVVQVIVKHYQKFVVENKVDLYMLSNDNAFLNYHPYYFTQRTLLTRFQMNNTSPPHIQFFKKPIYVAMALLSYMGDTVISSQQNQVVHLMTIRGTENSIILSYAADTNQNVNETDLKLEVAMEGGYERKFVVYGIMGSNPYTVWKKAGAPVFPDAGLRRRMRAAEGPVLLDSGEVIGNVLTLDLFFTEPSVFLVHICAKMKEPGPVTSLRVYNVTKNEVLITWNDARVGTRCVQTYEIEFRPEVIGNGIADQLFTRVNTDDVIFLWYQHVATGSGTTGLYRVRAVDYWGRPGPRSSTSRFP